MNKLSPEVTGVRTHLYGHKTPLVSLCNGLSIDLAFQKITIDRNNE